MNNKIRIIAISCLTFGVLTSLAFNKEKTPIEAEAAVGSHSAPAATYYDEITATSGTELLGQLHDLITDTHKTYTVYDDSGSTGYQKYTDLWYEGENPSSGYIREFYSGTKWANTWSANAGDYPGGYNREHIWPKSLSANLWPEDGKCNGTGGGDMHHIRPSEVRINTTRNNHKYGEVSGGEIKYVKQGSNETYAVGGYYANKVFEPIDTVKGDVARIILYVYTHYNTYSSSIFDGNATTNGDGGTYADLLPLTNVINASNDQAAAELLLSWHKSDPVDFMEQKRNDQVAIYQGNRNPFIDNPDYVNAIWGDGEISNEGGESSGSESESDNNSESESSGESTPAEGESVTVTTNIADYAATNNWTNSTKYTEIELDSNITATVTGGANTGKYYTSGENWRIYQNESPTLKISAADGYEISSVKITYTIDNSGVLTLNGTNIDSGNTVNVNSKSVTFSVGNKGTATNGQVRVTSIEVVYTATTGGEGGNESETPVEPTLLSISVSGQTTEFTVGGTFEFDGTVTATYSDESTADVTEFASFSGYDMSTASEQTVTVEYEGKTTTYQITVNAVEEGDNTPVTYDTRTVTTNIAEYADIYGWEDATQYTTLSLDKNITAKTSESGNTGKYYVNGENWRLYQTNSSTLTISASGNWTISSMKISYSISNSGVLTLDGANITSDTKVDVNGSSVTFGVGNTGTATNGQVRITDIEVIYLRENVTGTLVVAEEPNTNSGNSSLDKIQKYLFAAPDKNNSDTYHIMNPSSGPASFESITINSFSTNKDDYASYFFTTDENGGRTTICGDGSCDGIDYTHYYLGINSSEEFTSASSWNNRPWSYCEAYSYGKQLNDVFPYLFYSSGRGILYNASEGAFKNYETSNDIYGTSDYTGLYLFRVDTAFNFLKEKLASANCDNMLTAEFIERLEYLYSKLSYEEIELMKTTEYTTSEGTYTMSYGYQFAMDRYNGGVSSDSGRLLRIINSNSYYVVMIISMIGVGALLGAIIIKKRKSR